MKNKAFKTMTLILVFVMACSLMLSGCGGTNQTATEKSASSEQTSVATESTQPGGTENQTGEEWKSDTSPYEMNVWLGYSWAANKWDVSTMPALKTITEKTGVQIKYTIPQSNEKDALNMLIASGDLPETIIIDWADSNVKRLISGGQLYSYNELIDENCPKFWDIIDKDIITYHKQDDGKLYYLPSFADTTQSIKVNFLKTAVSPYFVRKDIYEALGSPKMETPDEVINVLKTVKEKYKDVEPIGLAGEFGLHMRETSLANPTTNFSFLAAGFGCNPSGYFQDGEQVKFNFRDPNYVELMKFMNRLYKEGLITTEQLVEKDAQIQEKVNSAKYFWMPSGVNSIVSTLNTKLTEKFGNDSKTYVCSGNFKVAGKGDPKYNANHSMGWTSFLITKKASKPDRIIKFLEYIWSKEGQLDMNFGTEGQTYDLVDGNPVFKDDAKQLLMQGKFDEKYGVGTLFFFVRPEFYCFKNKAMQEKGLPIFDSVLNPYAVDTVPLGYANMALPADSKELTVKEKISQAWEKTMIKMMMSKTDDEFNGAYKSGIEEVDSLGAGDVEKIFTDIRQKNLALAK